MNLGDLVAEIDERVLRLRRIRRTLESEHFFAAYETLDKEKLQELVQSGDDEGLRALIRKEVKTELGSMTLRQLRRLAKGRRIPRYHLLPKPILLSELTNAGAGRDSQNHIGHEAYS